MKHKERLKQLKLETDVLTLTATPIPRTLHLSLAGLRDMTLMQTPPRDRSPVLTFVEPWDDGLIEEGISRELDRGGQVFFVHNRIETIEAIADHIRRIVPRARDRASAHGQMRERELEDVMHEFVNGEVDVLVSTMIVEIGPRRAEREHDVREPRRPLRPRAALPAARPRRPLAPPRVLLPPRPRRRRSPTPSAGCRCSSTTPSSAPATGSRSRTSSCAARGTSSAPEQSGFVHAVGFDMYLRMLEETVQRLMRGRRARRSSCRPTSRSTSPTYLPDDYVASQDAKLDVYRRLARFEDADGRSRRCEPRCATGSARSRRRPKRCSRIAQLRVLGGALGIEGILVRGDEARITFRDSAVPG